MSSPSEKLAKILDAVVPSEVRFKPKKGAYNNLYLAPYKTKQLEHRPLEDSSLQTAFKEDIHERWDGDAGKYFVDRSPEDLFRLVKQRIQVGYDNASLRCAATRRKTVHFLNGISLDNRHLANYLLQMYVTMKKPEFENISPPERRAFFEPLETLRRTYGKR